MDLSPDFFILVQLIIQCNNSYHSEKRREIHHTGRRKASMTLYLVLLLQFKVMLSSDKYKKIYLHVFLEESSLLKADTWIWTKRWETCKKTWVVKLENRNNFIATQRKLKVSHSLVIVFQWLFILLICITMPVNRFLYNTTVLWYELVVIFEQVELKPKLNLVYLGHPE